MHKIVAECHRALSIAVLICSTFLDYTQPVPSEPSLRATLTNHHRASAAQNVLSLSQTFTVNLLDVETPPQAQYNLLVHSSLRASYFLTTAQVIWSIHVYSKQTREPPTLANSLKASRESWCTSQESLEIRC